MLLKGPPCWIAWLAATLAALSVALLIVALFGAPFPTLALLLVTALVGVGFEVGLKRWARRISEDLGYCPDGPAPEPQRPSSLDKPSLHLPRFVPPEPTLPPPPLERLPGRWDRCNVCRRPLTDATSRFRGIGPDCYRRERVYWPQGPVNPAYKKWEQEVERIRQEHSAVVDDARDRHEERIVGLRADHTRAVAAWEARAEERQGIQAAHDQALAIWKAQSDARRRKQAIWRADPRQELLRATSRLRTRLLAGAGMAMASAIWIEFLQLQPRLTEPIGLHALRRPGGSDHALVVAR